MPDTCDSGPGGKKFYPGISASKTYNNTFSKSHKIQLLNEYVPQGLGIWRNWDNKSEDLFLVGMHHKDEDHNQSLIYGMDTQTGQYRGAILLPVSAHVGGVKTYQDGKRQWLFAHKDTRTILRYDLDEVRRAFLSNRVSYLQPAAAIRMEKKVSFLDIADGYLYSGSFDEFLPGKMHRWRVGPSGQLERDLNFAKITPVRTQGVLVLPDQYIYVTSYAEKPGELWLTENDGSRSYEDSDHACLITPVLSEELVNYRGWIYLSYEGGSKFFDGTSRLTTSYNKITNLHRVPTSTLLQLSSKS